MKSKGSDRGLELSPELAKQVYSQLATTVLETAVFPFREGIQPTVRFFPDGGTAVITVFLRCFDGRVTRLSREWRCCSLEIRV